MDQWKDILKNIESDRYQYISFDIFDTLLLRPFWKPSDLFYFIGISAKKMDLVGDQLEFLKLRVKAEEKARLNCRREDVTIDDIYRELQRYLNISEKSAEQLKFIEKSLELHFCYIRKSGYELYCKAMECNKKVIFISDMYLEESDIQAILSKNGYKEYKKMYISSKIGLAKYTGNLYRYVLNDLSISNKDILHIGDNKFADIEKALEYGIDSYHLENVIDLYKSAKDDNINLLGKRIDMAIKAGCHYDNPLIDSAKVDHSEWIYGLFDEYKEYLSDSGIIISENKLSFIYRIYKKLRRLLYKIKS